MTESHHQPTHADDQLGLAYTPSEADLRENERLFRATFERAVIGIGHSSPEGRWLRVNQQLCDLLGYTCEELTAHTFQDLTHPDDLDASIAYLHRLLAGELDAFELDKRYVRKDGMVVWVHITVSLVRTPEGVPDYFITMVQDITERKRLEQERVRLLEQERAARWEAEAAHARLQALQALTDTALSHLALDDLLRELLDRVTTVMGVDHVAILLLEEDGRTLTVRAACGLLGTEVDRVRIPVGQGFAGRIAANRGPLIVDDTSVFDLYTAYPLLREQLHSVVGVPLLVQDPVQDSMEGRVEGQAVSRLVGVIHVGSATPRGFTEADVQLLQRAADRVALAIDRARLYAAEQESRQRAEAALAQAQASEAEATARAERLNTILETMADGVAVYDTAGRPIQVVNRAYRELFALERGPVEFEGLTTGERMALLDVRDAATGVELPLAETPVGRALRGEVVTGPGADVRVRAFDGRELELNINAAPLRDGDRHVTGVMVVLRDMTERNRLAREREAARADELAAREVNRRMEAFLAVAAHDLRSPLTAIVGFLDLAALQIERLTDAVREAYPEVVSRVESVRGRLEDASQGAERLTRLLARLFDLAAIRADRLELHRASCDLAALVREQVAGHRVAAPGRTIRLHSPADDRLIPVEADADRVGEVMANYLTNALKYSPQDQPIDVAVEVLMDKSPEGSAQVPPTAAGGGGGRGGDGEWVRVAVRDRGPGLPEAERARVWERFHRVAGVTEQGGTQGGSLGLGLHICKANIEAHGGQVGIETVLGEGSTFWFTLPLSRPLVTPPTA